MEVFVVVAFVVVAFDGVAFVVVAFALRIGFAAAASAPAPAAVGGVCNGAALGDTEEDRRCEAFKTTLATAGVGGASG